MRQAEKQEYIDSILANVHFLGNKVAHTIQEDPFSHLTVHVAAGPGDIFIRLLPGAVRFRGPAHQEWECIRLPPNEGAGEIQSYPFESD